MEESMPNLIREGPSYELPNEDEQLPKGEYDGSQYVNMTGDGDDASND